MSSSLTPHPPAIPRRPRCARVAVLTVLIGGLMILPSVARAANAAPPPNDDRDNAANIGALPATVHGTTVASTLEANEPGSTCSDIGASVWYAVTTGTTAPSRIGIKLVASQNLDAAVDVFVRQRSQDLPVTCRQTDSAGKTAIAFPPQPNTTYLIRVGQRANSDPGTFALRVFPLPPPPSPPGRHLGRRGNANGLLDGTLATSVAYSAQLVAGTTYKINLVKPNTGCLQLNIFSPGTSSFDSTPVAGLSCGGYRLFTPSTSGRWSFLIDADPNNPGTQAYWLYVRPATDKEMAPGIFLPNLAHYTGFLRGNVDDDVRLFRFDVTAHSDLTLFLQAASNAPFDLKLLNDRGHYLQCNCGSTGEETIRRQIQPGRYFIVVQAETFGSGPFTLYRETRLITHIHTTIDGVDSTQLSPGAAARIDATVSPAVTGPVTIEIDYFDPVGHWQFHHRYQVEAVNGHAGVSFIAPHVGRWRAESTFNGTRTASPAFSTSAQMLVAGPLQQ